MRPTSHAYPMPVGAVLAASRANVRERKARMADKGIITEVEEAEVEVTDDMEAELSEMGKGDEE